MATQSVSQPTLSALRWAQVRLVFIGAVLVSFLIAFGIWGGMPPSDKVGAFVAGILVLTAMLFALAGVSWYLLFRPLPAGQSVQAIPLKGTYRRATALALAVGSISSAIGGFWDQVWHQKYGIPFGADFFWRPHIMLYFGFAVVIALAFVALFMLNRNGKGTFPQRFHAAPIFGLLILMGAFLMYALPADPIWHSIYGVDLGAWSVPHLLLMVNFVTMMLLSVAIHMTLVARRTWSSFLHFSTDDILPVLMFGITPLIWMQIFTVEWDTHSRLIAGRPEWLLPALIAAGATLFGVAANHATRRWGMATLTGLIALGIRALLIQAFQTNNIYTNAWVVELAPMVLIDVWCAYRVQRGQSPSWLGSGVAAAIGMSAMILLAFKQLYPALTITSMPLTLAVVALTCLGISWVGAKIGDYMAESNKQVEAVSAPAAARVPLATLGVLAAACLFIAFYVVTAVPPVK